MKIVAPAMPVQPLTQLLATTAGAKPAVAFGADEALPTVAPAAPPPASAAQVAQAMQPLVSVAMLTTVAAADPDKERRRKMAEPAEDGIEKLEMLHAALVGGTVQPEQLAELQQWIASVSVPQDPTLAAILQDIDLRVRVEMAKLDVEI